MPFVPCTCYASWHTMWGDEAVRFDQAFFFLPQKREIKTLSQSMGRVPVRVFVARSTLFAYQRCQRIGMVVPAWEWGYFS